MGKNIFKIVLIGLFLIGCGENGKSNNDSSIDLPNSSKDFSLQKIESEDKKEGFSDLSSDDDSSTDDTVDNDNSNNDNSINNTNAPEQNKDILAEPFKKIIDIFNIQYNKFPTNSTHQETENYITKIIVDDNGMIHAVVSQIAWWLGVKSNGHSENSMSRNFSYYYIKYNPKTGEKSLAKKIECSRKGRGRRRKRRRRKTGRRERRKRKESRLKKKKEN